MNDASSGLTRVSYLYRDAGNYKFWGAFFIDGKIARQDVEPYLFDDTGFVPEMVGLAPLRPADGNEDDHFVHELGGFEPAEQGAPLCTAAEFVKRMQYMQKMGYFPR